MNDNELMDNSTPIDESFKRLMTFAKNHRPNGGLSNMYIIKTVDEDGNITPTYVEDCMTVSQTKIQSRLCEDWSLTSDYDSMPDKAEIEGEVDESALEEAKEQAEKMSTEEE